MMIWEECGVFSPLMAFFNVEIGRGNPGVFSLPVPVPSQFGGLGFGRVKVWVPRGMRGIELIPSRVSCKGIGYIAHRTTYLLEFN